MDNIRSFIHNITTTSKGKADITDEDEEKIDYEHFPILRYVKKSVIGHGLVVKSPFGNKKVTYCDYTASGRSLSFLEDYIRTYVLPYYGNTHTTTSVNSRQTSIFRDEARELIKECVNAGDHDAVIFTGSGCTSAIHKLLWGLNLNKKEVAKNAVVIVGPYEHHSNMLPWIESGAHISRIKDTLHGLVDLDHLDSELKKWSAKGNKPIIVSISAASNVTGILTDTVAIAEIVHKYDAYVIFDYATAGAYVNIDMNATEKGYKDAVVISPHKFVGGPQTPGVLITKKWMFANPIPGQCGGGTVMFVTRDTHLYLKDIEAREEGGTPAIIESIRAGMVFQLKRAIGTDVIEAREEDLCKRAFTAWKHNSAMAILGSHTSKRLPIFSFLVRHEQSGKFLHHNFVSALLNDLYGIQARGGCACAGPYAEDLLGIAEDMAQKFTWFLKEREVKTDKGTQQVASLEIMKPGFTRLNLPYFYDDHTIDYIIEAVDMVVHHGWKFLPYYSYDSHTGAWNHTEFFNNHGATFFSLRDISYDQKGLKNSNKIPPSEKHKVTLEDMLQSAEKLIEKLEDKTSTVHAQSDHDFEQLLTPETANLRWFLTPHEAMAYLQSGSFMGLVMHQRKTAPFKPRNRSVKFRPTHMSLSSENTMGDNL